MLFSGIDICILLLILISVIISAIRGFFREALSLATWVAAILITLMFTSRFATLLPRNSIESPEARFAISALVLFIGCLLLGGLINYLFLKIRVPGKGKDWTDFWLGIVFGTLRGIVIVALLVLLANLNSSFKQENWWRTSLFIPPFQRAAFFLHAQLPTELAQHFDFSAAS